MIDLKKEVEAEPASYPDIEARWFIARLSQDQDPGTEQVWQRIEGYTRTRYTDRAVLWIIEANEGDDWTPPLSPITALSAERWEGGAWVAVTLPDGPLGYCIPCDGQYRVTAQVGGGDVPAAVAEAFKRLHEYSRGIAEQFKNNAASYSDDGSSRAVHWAARAIQLSGAADVLRPYRRQK